MIQVLRKLFPHSQRSGDPQPNLVVERTLCPFYGFSAMGVMVGSMLLDTGGNQCPLEGANTFSPCQMEMAGEMPDWDSCPYNKEENREVIDFFLQEFTIAPKEYWPVGKTSWKGLSFSWWFDHITKS